MRQTGATCVAIGVVTVLLTACSTSTPTAPANAPTEADASVVAEGIQTSIESSLESFIGGVQPVVPISNRTRSAAAMPYLQLAHVPFDLTRGLSAPHARPGITIRDIPSCVTTSPANPLDTDGDGIPDTAALTAPQGCSFVEDSLTFTISGSMTEGDPTPSTADADYAATVNNLAIGVTSGGSTASIGLNGTANVSETSGSLSESNDLTITVAATGAETLSASYAQNWMATFLFTGAPLLGSGALPAGTLNITGTTTYTGGAKTFALAVTTPTPLTYDPTCNTNSKITGGTVQAVFSGTSGGDYTTLTWSGCQDPTVTFTHN